VLRTRCDEVSPTVVNQRLAELREAGIVAHEDGAGYALSSHVEALLAGLAPLNDWAAHWARRKG